MREMSEAVIIALIVSVGPTLLALVNFVITIIDRKHMLHVKEELNTITKKVDEVVIATNGQAALLLQVAGDAKFSEGKLAGKLEQRLDDRKDKEDIINT